MEKKDEPKLHEDGVPRVTSSLGGTLVLPNKDIEMWDDGTIVGALDNNNNVEEHSMHSNDEEVALQEPANNNDDDDEALPIASIVKPPPELLERLHQLEQERNAVPHATPVDENEVIEERRRRKRRLVILIASSLLVVLSILLGALLGTRNNTSTNNITDPTSSPTLSPEAEAIRDLIESVSFDGGAALHNASSPQSMALEWLLQDSVNATNVYEDWRLIQRYVLAVLYYSTSGENWKESEKWLSRENECTWFTRSPADEIPVCRKTDGRYLHIVLEGNGLSGTIPVELALLSDSLRK